MTTTRVVAASEAPEGEALSEIGEGEGALSILAWPGYAEDGSTSTKASTG